MTANSVGCPSEPRPSCQSQSHDSVRNEQNRTGPRPSSAMIRQKRGPACCSCSEHSSDAHGHPPGSSVRSRAALPLHRATTVPRTHRGFPFCINGVHQNGVHQKGPHAAVRSHQHEPASLWAGGHGTSPYEQKTQQSPDSGRSVVPHAGQSQKNWQLSAGISTAVFVPHSGHVRVDVV